MENTEKQNNKGFHKVHCPRCGRTMYANELAFDFGKIINIALEKSRNMIFGSNEDWYDLTNFNLCLYLSLDDLRQEYGLKQMPDGTYLGDFVFTTKKLEEQILLLADSSNPNISIDMLASGNPGDKIEFNNLTRFMGKSNDMDVMELAAHIQELCDRIQKNPDVVIARFRVTVCMQKDDRGNNFANHLKIQYDDGDLNNITDFICKGEMKKGEKIIPCGKKLYSHAGQFKEIIIVLAGTARVGKTAYLASLLACIMREGNGIERLGYDQNIIINIANTSEAYNRFKQDLLDPYTNCDQITKTQNIFDKIGDTEAISLFSITFSVKQKVKYIFTFIDMPGEIYDDGERGANEAAKNRQIISEASMIWLCIAPPQITGGAMVAGGDRVNTDLGTAFANMHKTLQALNCVQRIPTAVLITMSDLIETDYRLFDSSFNPFESASNPIRTLEEKNEATPWIDQSGVLYYSNMEWFVQKAFEYLEINPGLPASIENIFGSFTPFAVASYGKQINNPLAVKAGFDIPTPSMIEGPFLWTLGLLDLISVRKEKVVTKTRMERKFFIFNNPVTYQETVNELVKDRQELFYYHSV